jgi:hypothetical protein
MYHRLIFTILLLAGLYSCQSPQEEPLLLYFDQTLANLELANQEVLESIFEVTDIKPHSAPFYATAERIDSTASEIILELDQLEQTWVKNQSSRKLSLEERIQQLDKILFLGRRKLFQAFTRLVDYSKEEPIKGVKFDEQYLKEFRADFYHKQTDFKQLKKLFAYTKHDSQELQLLFQQYRHQIKFAELQLLEFLNANCPRGCWWSYYVLPILNSSPKAMVLLGEDYETEFMIGEMLKRAKFKLKVDGKKLNVKYGKAQYNAKPQSIGTHQYKVDLELRDPNNGKLIKLQKTFEYEVVDSIPVAAVSLNHARVLSRCFNNPMKLVVPNYPPEEITLRGSEGLVINRLGDYRYSILVPGAIPNARKARVEVVHLKTNKVLASFDYKIIPCPTPTAVLTNGKSDGRVSAVEMRVQRGIMAPILNHDVDARCKVIGFQMYHVGQGKDPIVLKNKGGRFEAPILEQLKNLQTGDLIQFTDVMARCPGDLVAQRLNSLAFMIR